MISGILTFELVLHLIISVECSKHFVVMMMKSMKVAKQAAVAADMRAPNKKYSSHSGKSDVKKKSKWPKNPLEMSPLHSPTTGTGHNKTVKVIGDLSQV